VTYEIWAVVEETGGDYLTGKFKFFLHIKGCIEIKRPFIRRALSYL